jgi:hypothetical protein
MVAIIKNMEICSAEGKEMKKSEKQGQKFILVIYFS